MRYSLHTHTRIDPGMCVLLEMARLHSITSCSHARRVYFARELFTNPANIFALYQHLASSRRRRFWRRRRVGQGWRPTRNDCRHVLNIYYALKHTTRNCSARLLKWWWCPIPESRARAHTNIPTLSVAHEFI